MYHPCSICNKGLEPNNIIKIEKYIDNKKRVILPYYFCKDCYKIFEQRLKDYLIK